VAEEVFLDAGLEGTLDVLWQQSSPTITPPGDVIKYQSTCDMADNTMK
jgi:hypothetical protein